MKVKCDHRYAKELLDMCHASSDTIVEERIINIITFELGKIYQIQNEFGKKGKTILSEGN